MFTGLVETLGKVRGVRRGEQGMTLTIAAGFAGEKPRLGDSVAVNGACLTLTSLGEEVFSADVSTETLACTTLGDLTVGSAVNLERALRLGDRLGGHLVTGHIDGVGTLRQRQPRGNATLFSVAAPPQVLRYLVPKGSIAVDGVSLTVNEVDDESFSLMVIPHTLGVTTLREMQPGSAVNLEADLLGKYVERLLAGRQQAPAKPSFDLDFLAKNGYL